MLSQILQEGYEFREQIKFLKINSTYYPKVFMKHENNFVIAASTLVRIERGGKWYKVHCVERKQIKNNNADSLLLKLMESVHQLQNLYTLTGEEDVDELQISEIERLTGFNINAKKMRDTYRSGAHPYLRGKLKLPLLSNSDKILELQNELTKAQLKNQLKKSRDLMERIELLKSI